LIKIGTAVKNQNETMNIENPPPSCEPRTLMMYANTRMIYGHCRFPGGRDEWQA